MAAKLGGIEGEPIVSYKNKPSLSSILFGSTEEKVIRSESMLRYLFESPFGFIEA